MFLKFLKSKKIVIEQGDHARLKKSFHSDYPTVPLNCPLQVSRIEDNHAIVSYFDLSCKDIFSTILPVTSIYRIY